MHPYSFQQSRVVINSHNDLTSRSTLLLDRFYCCNELVPAFLCVGTNYDGNIEQCICHHTGSLSCRYRVTEAELRRISCHTGVLARIYKVVAIEALCPLSNAAKAST